MGNTRSAEVVSVNEPCLGRYHHEPTDDTTEKRYEDSAKRAEGNVSTSEMVSEVSDGETPLSSRGRRREEDILKSKDIEAKEEGTESTPAQKLQEDPPTKRETGDHEKSEMDEEESDLCVEDHCPMKNRSPEGETKEGEISDSEEQTPKTEDLSAASTSHGARMGQANVTQKGGLRDKEAVRIGDEDGQENELEEWKTNGILGKVITKLKKTSRRRKKEKDEIKGRETALSINTDDVLTDLETHEDENTQRITEDVTEEAAATKHSDVPLKQKGRWKKIFTRLRKRKISKERKDREVSSNSRDRKRKMNFFTFMSRIKDVERGNEAKDECSNSSSDSVIYKDINIQGGDKEKEGKKSNKPKEKSKEEYEREQLEEKEQWRWDAEEGAGSTVIKKRR